MSPHGVVFTLNHISHQQAALNDKNKTLAESERRVAEMSAEKKTKAEDDLFVLRADMEHELVVSRGLKDEMSRE